MSNLGDASIYCGIMYIQITKDSVFAIYSPNKTSILKGDITAYVLNTSLRFNLANIGSTIEEREKELNE